MFKQKRTGRDHDQLKILVLNRNMAAITKGQEMIVIKKGSLVFVRDNKQQVEGYGIVKDTFMKDEGDLDSTYYEVISCETAEGEEIELDKTDFSRRVNYSFKRTGKTSTHHHSKVLKRADFKPERKNFLFRLLGL